MIAEQTSATDTLKDLASLQEGTPIVRKGAIIGCYRDDEFARYCRLGPIIPDNRTRSRAGQTESVFETMADALTQCDMVFTDIARTWFYLDDLLAWYDQFNAVRTAFFEKHGTFKKMVPSSTGIGIGNPYDAALVAGLIAIKPHNGKLALRAVDSPLQGSALDYKSSFSRAVEVASPCTRALYISGTASIDRDGNSIHVDDPAAQIRQTMEVVAAILKSRDMSWANTTRGIVYYPDTAYHTLFNDYCLSSNIPEMPLRIMQSDVCRRELLFEIEIDAQA